MQKWIDSIPTETLWLWGRAGFILVIGLLVARFASRWLYQITEKPMGIAGARTVRRIAFYALALVVTMAALRELGFSLGVLLGAAGVVSVAVGFASQTSASNLISGIFLVAEKPFEVGDIIKVGNYTGEVLSVDFLSVKIRTFDNLFVRLPNETLIKTEMVNMTRFPIRRLDLQIGVAYREDIVRVRELLVAVADEFPLCMDQPRPMTIFQGFGDSSLDLQFSVWARRENYLQVRNTLPELIKAAFDKNDIEIPFPHRTLYAGSRTDPIPIRMMSPIEQPIEQPGVQSGQETAGQSADKPT